MRFRPAILLAASTAAGCGLLFGDRSGAGGGGGGGTGPSGTGAGGDAPSHLLKQCTGDETSPWGFTFAAAEVEDVAPGPNGRTYFAGTAISGSEGGLLGHAVADGTERFYVGEASELGCDVWVQTLGPVAGSGDDIRLSHGDAEEVFVAWAQSDRLCVREAGAHEPDARCDDSAVLFCSAGGPIGDPGVAYDEEQDAFLLSFHADAAGSVTCQRRGATPKTWNVEAGSYLWSTLSDAPLYLGGGVSRVRLATAGTDRVRVTGHCNDGLLLGTLQCPAQSPSFVVFTAELSVVNPAPQGMIEFGAANVPHSSESMTLYPAAGGWVATIAEEPDSNRRHLEWKNTIPQGDTYGPVDSPVLGFRSAEMATSGFPDLFVASGASDLDIGLACPSGGVCIPGEPHAFYALLTHDLGLRGSALPVEGPDTCRSSRASGAHQLADETIVVGGDYACGSISGLPGSEAPALAGDARAMFLARMPALPPP